jgi:hypothetical protein
MKRTIPGAGYALQTALASLARSAGRRGQVTRQARLLIGTAAGLGLAAVAWLAARQRLWTSEPRRPALPRSGNEPEKRAATKPATKRAAAASATRTRTTRGAARGASARKAPVARRSRPRA